jgi:hypothetical protein
LIVPIEPLGAQRTEYGDSRNIGPNAMTCKKHPGIMSCVLENISKKLEALDSVC